MPARRGRNRLSNAHWRSGFPPAPTVPVIVPPAAGGRRAALLIRLAVGAALAAITWTLAAGAAVAGFSVCNQTLDVVNVAIGSQQGEVFRTEGWWTVGSNQCANVIRDDLQYRYIFVYATDVFGQELLQGSEPMCVAAEKFTIEGTDECWTRGHRQTKFLEVDTHDQDNWTLFLSDPDGG